MDNRLRVISGDPGEDLHRIRPPLILSVDSKWIVRWNGENSKRKGPVGFIAGLPEGTKEEKCN